MAGISAAATVLAVFLLVAASGASPIVKTRSTSRRVSLSASVTRTESASVTAPSSESTSLSVSSTTALPRSGNTPTGSVTQRPTEPTLSISVRKPPPRVNTTAPASNGTTAPSSAPSTNPTLAPGGNATVGSVTQTVTASQTKPLTITGSLTQTGTDDATASMTETPTASVTVTGSSTPTGSVTQRPTEPTLSVSVPKPPRVNTTAPASNGTTAPSSAPSTSTAPPMTNTTAVPSTNTSSAPGGNSTLAPGGNSTLAPGGANGTTGAPSSTNTGSPVRNTSAPTASNVTSSPTQTNVPANTLSPTGGQANVTTPSPPPTPAPLVTTGAPSTSCSIASSCSGHAVSVTASALGCQCACADQWAGPSCDSCPARYTALCSACALHYGGRGYPSCYGVAYLATTWSFTPADLGALTDEQRRRLFQLLQGDLDGAIQSALAVGGSCASVKSSDTTGSPAPISASGVASVSMAVTVLDPSLAVATAVAECVEALMASGVVDVPSASAYLKSLQPTSSNGSLTNSTVGLENPCGPAGCNAAQSSDSDGKDPVLAASAIIGITAGGLVLLLLLLLLVVFIRRRNLRLEYRPAHEVEAPLMPVDPLHFTQGFVVKGDEELTRLGRATHATPASLDLDLEVKHTSLLLLSGRIPIQLPLDGASQRSGSGGASHRNPLKQEEEDGL